MNFIYNIFKYQKRAHVTIMLCVLILLTELVTPNFQPPHPFRLSQIEARMVTTGKSMNDAYADIINDYLTWHKTVSNSSELQKTVRILSWNGMGDSGLGDKIRGVLHALMLAIETERYFVIEDVPEFPIRRIVRAGELTWDTELDFRNEPLFNWRTSFSRGQQGIRRLSQPHFEERHLDHRVVRLASSTHPMYERTVSTAHWRFACRRLRPTTLRDERCGYLGTQNIYFNRLLYAVLFKPRRAVQNIIESLESMLPNNSSSPDFIAIHARLGGKFRREATTSRFASLNEDWYNTSRYLLSCADVRGRNVYLATDDEEFKSVFSQQAKEFDANLIISPIKPRHSGTVPLAEMYTALTNTFAEALFLGKASQIITTGSGMATFAAVSGKAELKLLEECYESR